MFRDDSIIRDNLSSLLLLLDRLEVQIYNASNGCATNVLPSVPRSSLVFFRTNKKTCKEYFARIRPAIIQGAKMLHDDGLLIRNTLQVYIYKRKNSSFCTYKWWWLYSYCTNVRCFFMIKNLLILLSGSMKSMGYCAI